MKQFQSLFVRCAVWLVVAMGMVPIARGQTTFVYTNTATRIWSTATGVWTNDLGNANIPVVGGSNDYTVVFKNASGVLSPTNDLGNPSFMLNGLSFLGNIKPLVGSNLVFVTKSDGVTLPRITFDIAAAIEINNNIVLTTNLTLLTAAASISKGNALNGIISGVGDLIFTSAPPVDLVGMVGCYGVNTFTGNWNLCYSQININYDYNFGYASNSIILNGGSLRTGNGWILGGGRTITVGPNGGVITVPFNTTIGGTNQLQGSGGLSLTGANTLTINKPQTNFSGTVSVTGAGLTLSAANIMTNTITATNTLLTVNNANAFGSGGVVVQANAQVVLGAAPGSSGIYSVSDLGAIGGSDAYITSLSSGVNLSAATGAMIVHTTANSTAAPVGVSLSNLVYGLGVAMNTDLVIGDAVASQWRGVGVARTSYALGTSANTLTLNGNAELDALSGGTLTINSLITGVDATKLLAIRGGGSVTLNNVNNNFASRIFGAGGTTLNASHTAGTMTFNLANTNNIFAAIQNTATGTLVLQGGISSNIFGSIKNNSTGTLVLNGESGSTNILTGSFGGTANGTLVFSNGYYKSLGGQRHIAGNLTVAGGTFVVTGDRLGMEYANQQLNIFGGSLSATNNTYGFRLGSDGGLGQAASASVNFTGLQTNGIVAIYTSGMELGGFTTANVTNRYTLSGGSLNITGTIWLGSKDLTAPTSFVLTNQGVLSVQGTIMGGTANTASSMALFIFNGGTLIANAINTTYLRDTALAAPGTFVNAGGALAPGDVGTAGKTTIIGSYSNAPSAVLAIDIGGTTQGSAFQNAGNYYDTLSVSAGAVLDGRLNVSLINGYVPATTATKFTVLTSTGLSGSFSNVTAGKVWCADGYSRFDVLTPANTVVLSNYVVNAWSPTSGSTWDTAANWSLATDPNNSALGAYFGMGGSGTVTLDTAHTVRGLTFTNSAASYTIAGAALTLQGDTLTTPKISVLAGSHTISAAMALSNATEIAVAASSMLTLTGGITGGQAVTKTGTGTLVLSNVNTLGALTVSAGTVRFAADTTTVSALTMTAGATCDFTAGTLYILKNGGGTDTIEKVNAAITANSITLRGKTAMPVDFKVTEEGSYIKVTAKLKGTMIMMM